jgi:hypothetical protein
MSDADADASFMDSINCSEWTATSYNGNTNNCYDFAVAALNVADRSSLKHLVWTKESVCKYLLPYTRKVAQYVSVKRKTQQLRLHYVKTGNIKLF